MYRSLAEFPVPQATATGLNYDQVLHFMEEGYVVASGLIPREIAARADDLAWGMLGCDRDKPETWKDVRRQVFTEHPDVMAMYTPGVLTAAAQLASADPHLFNISRVPLNAYILTIKPTPGAEWGIPKPHLDGLGTWEGIINSFPRPWTMFAMIYLHDVPRHCGNTVVYPRSHRKYQALLRAEPERYRFLAQLRDDLSRIDPGKPLELEAKAGDVAFIDQMLLHEGSVNCGRRPRFAMNMKW